MFQRLCALLEDAGAELSPEELHDVLWLAVTTAPADGRGTVPVAEPAAVPEASGAAADGGTGEEPERGRSAEPRRDGDKEDEPADRQGLFAPGGPRRTAARPARSVGVRGVPALPGARGLARALRPLRQTVPARRSYTLDEAATADWIADTGLPDAVLRPERERWLSVALVVDDGPSMVLWQQLAAEVQALLERQGAFLHVRVHGLDSSSATEPVLTARPYAAGAPRRGPGHLTDLSGRTAVLVLSDGVGPGWRSGAVPRALLNWARHSPVAVIQPLPPRMWPEQGMPTQRLLVSADRPGAPGRALSVRHPVLPPGLVSYEGTVVPVLDLSPGQLGAWADLTATGRGSALLPVMLLDDGRERRAAAPAAGGTDPSPAVTPEERLQRFRAAASPESQRLAGVLASVSPLTLPVMRLIHQAGRHRAEHRPTAQLAEVFLGGLLRRRETGTRLPPDAVEYEFQPGVADLLLDAVQTSTALDTAAQVTDYLLRRQGNGPEFRARLAAATGDSTIADHARPFAAASPQLLLRLGLLVAGPPEEEHEKGAVDGEQPAPAPAPAELPSRSYTSEWVQPPLLASVRHLDRDTGLPATLRSIVDQILAEADERNEESGWPGVRVLRRLAGELVDAGRPSQVEELRGVIRSLLPGLADLDDLESRNQRGHLALALNKLGDHDEAEAHLRGVVEISGRVHGSTHDYTFFARDYLIDLLEDAGRQQAAELECRALIEAYEHRGDDSEGRVLSLRMTRGRLLLDLDRPAEAEAEFRAVHAGRLALDGARPFDIVLSQVWVATALQSLKRYDEAETEVRAAIEYARSVPDEQTALVTAQCRLGYLLDEQGRYDEALALWSELVDSTTAEQGPVHAQTRRVRRWRVFALRGLGRHAEAAADAAELAEAIAAALGERHVDHFDIRRIQAVIVKDQGRAEEAAAALRDLLAEQLELLGEEHPSTFRTLTALALALRAAGRREEALTYYTEKVQTLVRLGRQDEADTLATRTLRAHVLEELERPAEAEEEYRTVVKVRERLSGPDAPETLSARRALADTLRDQERHVEAEREFRSVVERRTRTLGPRAKETLGTRHSLGYVLNKLGRFADAEAEIRATYQARVEVLGPEDAATLWTRHNLGVALRGLGRLEEAAAELRAVLDVGERVLDDDHKCVRKTRALLMELSADGESADGG